MDEVEEIKERLSVAEVVGGYVQLKPSGRNLKGLCPFHGEKTPSMMVSPEKGIWHCFGCGEGGDIYKFVMKMEGLDFPAALEMLAKRAGVELKSRGRSNTKQKDQLKNAMEFATKYYQLTLIKNPRALDYLKKRGLTKQVIIDFRLGYAPGAGSVLVAALTKKGFTDNEITGAGLASSRGRLYDMFRSRLIFPIANERGEVVGMTGRVLNDETGGPKYLNTPQTLIYDKSRVIYGFHLAKAAIKEADSAVLVEGNMDVVATHQAGFKNVVATSGTALTVDQLKIISRLTKNIKLAFDQDAAGLKATERAIEISQQLDVNLSVIDMAGAKDPDELIKQNPKLWQQAVDNAKYVIDWLFDYYAVASDLKSSLGKRHYSDQLAPILRYLRDPVEQDHYIKLLAEKTGSDQDSIKQKLQQVVERPVRAVKAKETAEPKAVDRDLNIEENLLALALVDADTRVALNDVKDIDFTSDQRQGLYQILKKDQKSVSDKIAAQMTDVSDYVKILALQGEENFSEIDPEERVFTAYDLAKQLRHSSNRRRQYELTYKLQEAQRVGNDELAKELLTEYQTLLTSVKEF